MHAIEKEWQALRDAYEKDTRGKSQYVELSRSVDRLTSDASFRTGIYANWSPRRRWCRSWPTTEALT